MAEPENKPLTPQAIEKMGGQEFLEAFGLNPDGTWPDLHPDLQPFIHTTTHGIVCLKHPLVFDIGYTPFKNGMLNRMYEAKLKAIDHAEHAGDWSEYIWLHERPHRLGAFYGIRELLTDARYWTLLSEIWSDTENMWQEGYTWRLCLESDRPGRAENFMDEDEREVLAKLPNTFTIYRGTTKGHPPGDSWTLDQERAEWFAGRFRREGKPPAVLTGTVAKNDVIAYLGGRNESEIVVIHQNIQNITERVLEETI